MSKDNIKVGCVVLACACAVALAVGQDSPLGRPNATVSIRVVDEAGAPVEGVSANVWSLSDMEGHPGTTDRDGRYSCFLRDIHPPIAGLFTKSGFYRSIGDVWKRNSSEDLPTNILTVVLKRIVDPVPMVYREVTAVFPRLDEPVGFDFAEGDWVAPDGKGEAVDMTLTATKRFVSWDDFDFKVQIEFHGEHDGIRTFDAPASSGMVLASDLMPPQRAYDEGYERKTDAWIGQTAGGRLAHSTMQNRNYIFRVRTRLDDEGRILSANVGWIWGDLATSPTDKTKGEIHFSYYWNPDPQSRSLEPKEIADRQGR